ncbi:hypothetical protein SUNI508_13531 [Seiridium unicorne]|uniref:Uncharacterized protein n=1 Tax=Seiridium unicorne TaxID=138068 RepID=A0ABR2VCU0_9PEZI
MHVLVEIKESEQFVKSLLRAQWVVESFSLLPFRWRSI